MKPYLNLPANKKNDRINSRCDFSAHGSSFPLYLVNKAGWRRRLGWVRENKMGRTPGGGKVRSKKLQRRLLGSTTRIEFVSDILYEGIKYLPAVSS
jgi:hypothetical protein